MTPHNRQQKMARLEKEAAHFQSQMAKFEHRTTPQDKRRYTTALRCLKQRQRDIERLTKE